MCESMLHWVIEVGDDDTVLASDVHGAPHRVSLLAYDGLPPVRGTWLVVHCGYALASVDDAEAVSVLSELHRAGVLETLTESEAWTRPESPIYAEDAGNERGSDHDTNSR